jgi:subtilisin family serine protease
MKIRHFRLSLPVLLGSVFAAAFAAPPARGASFILRTAPAASAAAVADRHGLTIVEPVDAQNRGLFLVTVPDTVSADQLAADVKGDADVVELELDRDVVVPESPRVLSAGLTQSTAHILDAVADKTLVSFFGASARNAYVNQPAAALVRSAKAQQAFLTTGLGIVAIIDTGIDPTHPVLANSLVPGYDFIRDLPGLPDERADLTQSTAHILDQSTAHILDPYTVTPLNGATLAFLDQTTASQLAAAQLPSAFGHGTMVAGIVHLMAPTASIMPLKAFRADGSTDVFSILRAVYFAVDNGARVINMSFSLPAYSNELMKAMNYATSKGVVCVASTGNDGKETLAFPASFQNVLGVASTNALDQRSAFSNYGAALADISAPGEEIITTYPGGLYAAAWGTSFSTPFVAGASALLNQAKPGIGQADTAGALSHGAKISIDLGLSRLDAYAAVNKLQ